LFFRLGPIQNLSIWVVIKTLRHLCVIFNYGPDDCQGIPVIKEELMSLTLREASKDTLQAENKTWHYYSLPLAAKRLGTFRVYPSR
jgi:aconitate hydratase